MKKAQQEVLVQKDVKLASGESLSMFAQKVREAGQDFMARKLNIVTSSDGTSGGSIYPVDIFSKSVVFSVYKYGPTVKETDRNRYYAAAYTRNEDGTFEFSTVTEVERFTGYQAKQSAAPVAKAKDEGKHEDVSDAPGWAVKKSLWADVL